MNSQEQLGKNLKKARQKSGMTQATVAEKAEVHVNYYARIERGEVNPSIEILENIAKALKVNSSEILPF
ncbi:MAG: helix-turn-helix transcriptional regulator [Candidatus Woykebacteria bacterium]